MNRVIFATERPNMENQLQRISLRPSPLTELRHRLFLEVEDVAAFLNILPRQVEYLESHTRQLAPGMLGTIASAALRTDSDVSQACSERGDA